MNPAGLRRNFKNIVHNYSDAQVKVREATSNDPWGPSSTLMSEIADLTYNMMAFSEIMHMIWKRLNDHGRNWRHVYKSLVLLEYLIKTGTEKVAQQCKENIYTIETLKDFQYIEDNKDQGMNVREKAKQLVTLLKDDERLKNERVKALKAKERFAQATAGIGSDGQQRRNSDLSPTGYRSDHFDSGDASSPPGVEFQRDRRISTDLESARPQTAGEEELQLQLALAMSKEEAEQEEQKRRSDDVRLQMAITQSQEDFGGKSGPSKESALLDLLDVVSPSSSIASNGITSSTDPWGMPVQSQGVPPPPPARQQSADPWSSSSDSHPSPATVADPWTGRPASSLGVPVTANNINHTVMDTSDPWAPQPSASNSTLDPWGMANNSSAGTAFGSTPSLATNGDVDGFDLLGSRPAASKSTNNLDDLGGANLFDINGVGSSNGIKDVGNKPQQTKKTPESFLGENSGLVNLDSLVSSKPLGNSPSGVSTAGSTNPFAAVPGAFQNQSQAGRVPMNQLRTPHLSPAMTIPSPAFGTTQMMPMTGTLPPMSGTSPTFGAMGMAFPPMGGSPIGAYGAPLMPTVTAAPPMGAVGGIGMPHSTNNPFL